MTDSFEATILLNARDNVAVARRSIQPGGVTGRGDLTALELIGRGHKVALRTIKAGEEVLKYGQVIGVATQDIEPGRLVHLHNLAVVVSEHTHQFSVDIEEKGMLPLDERRTFMGFDRGAGGVGTRNYIGILTSVFTAVTVSRGIATLIYGRRRKLKSLAI